MWRSLVSRLNGVQEASSSNLDTRTKNGGRAYARPSFFYLSRFEQGTRAARETARWAVSVPVCVPVRDSASGRISTLGPQEVPKSFGFRYYLQHFQQFERSIVGRTEYGRNGIPPVLTTKQAKYAAENELAGTPAWPQSPGNGIAVAASSTGKETCRFAPQRCPQLSAVQRQVLLHPAKV